MEFNSAFKGLMWDWLLRSGGWHNRLLCGGRGRTKVSWFWEQILCPAGHLVFLRILIWIKS